MSCVAVPAATFRYRNETFRILADICWGTGALLVGGGTIGVMVLLSLSAGTSLGIEGFNGLELIGLSPLTGFVSAVVNTRELAPLIAALALASQVGCRFTAQIGSMRAHEEIDALEALAIAPIDFLVATRLVAAMVGDHSAVPDRPRRLVLRDAGRGDVRVRPARGHVRPLLHDVRQRSATSPSRW